MRPSYPIEGKHKTITKKISQSFRIKNKKQIVTKKRIRNGIKIKWNKTIKDKIEKLNKSRK